MTAGEPAGYHGSTAPVTGHLVMVGAGSAHGVVALEGGHSPFHHARRRMPLLEPPHMHTSMVLVALGDPVPEVGDWVDVQRPLIMVSPDEVVVAMSEPAVEIVPPHRDRRAIGASPSAGWSAPTSHVRWRSSASW